MRADGKFVFIRIANDRHELWLADAGGANARRVNTYALAQIPKWSPTGRNFVATLSHNTGNRLVEFSDDGSDQNDLGPCVDHPDW